MTAAALYPWIKALHLAAVLVFVSGVFTVGCFLRLALHRIDEVQAVSRQVRRWDRQLTTPAMLLAWVCGAQLAISGGWAHSGWLWAKLALVLVLSGIHGMQAGQLRRLSQNSTTPAAPAPSAWLLGACVLGISVLAVVKPF